MYAHRLEVELLTTAGPSETSDAFQQAVFKDLYYIKLHFIHVADTFIQSNL